MANELIHKTVGTELTQTEFEAVDAHQFNSQSTGDIAYASSATQLSRLGIGSNGQWLGVSGGLPAWASGTNPELITGSYAGNGSDARNVTTGFTCSLVFLTGSPASANMAFVVALPGTKGVRVGNAGGVSTNPTDCIIHLTNGFTVNSTYCNGSGTFFNYWAIST